MFVPLFLVSLYPLFYMNIDKKIPELEALLFYAGDPMSNGKIAEILELSEKEASELITVYKDRLAENSQSGLFVIAKDGKIQLATRPELDFIAEKLIKDELKEELTPAVLEVLTIVAYLGPISRTEIDFIRGVNSTYSLRNLTMRGFVEREKRGNAYSYSVSFDFLKHMGLDSAESLPEYDNYKDILKESEFQA